MKTREFDINNYKVDDIIREEVRRKAEEFALTFKHDFLTEDSKPILTAQTYYARFKTFANMSKKEQKYIEQLAYEQYVAKKENTIKEYEELKDKCDHIFYDDKQYKKLVPELTNLYYCQAHTALKDFYSKKISSKAASNSRFQARAMSYSTISCD